MERINLISSPRFHEIVRNFLAKTGKHYQYDIEFYQYDIMRLYYFEIKHGMFKVCIFIIPLIVDG